MEWISVKDRLPPPSKYNKHNAGDLLVVREGRVEKEVFWFFQQEALRKTNPDWAIKYWMPVPTPPTSQGEQNGR